MRKCKQLQGSSAPLSLYLRNGKELSVILGQCWTVDLNVVCVTTQLSDNKDDNDDEDEDDYHCHHHHCHCFCVKISVM